MTGQVYSVAVNRISQLETELQLLKSLVSNYRKLARQSPSVPREDFTTLAMEAAAPAFPCSTPQAELEIMVEQLLVANRAPMRRAEILAKLKSAGAVVGGRNELANLGSKLSRATRLMNLPRLGYWPKDHPYPDASYRRGKDVSPWQATKE